MGAVKAMAIELERYQHEAMMLSNPAAIYRMGLLEACRLITEQSSLALGKPEFLALAQCWEAVYDAVNYLREVEQLGS